VRQAGALPSPFQKKNYIISALELGILKLTKIQFQKKTKTNEIEQRRMTK